MEKSNTPVHNVESHSSPLLWGTMIALVLIILAGGYYWYIQKNGGGFLDLSFPSANSDGEQITPENSVVNDPRYEDLSEPLSEQEESNRLSRIAREREALLAERARLQNQASANANATSSAGGAMSPEQAQAQAERQQQIDAQLLELQNAEEYPPLPSPGL
ncbi:MAG: hypothetical protein ACKKL4_02875 [Patescibacteria group bacterium]